MPFPDARYDPYTGPYGSWFFNDGSGSLPGTPEEYQQYFGLQDPGVNVVTGYGTPDATTTNYSSTPFFGFPDGGQTFISNDPAEIAAYRENERTRNLQGALRVAALVGGGAIGNALWSGASGASGGAATTYPLAPAGGSVTATPIAAGGGGGGLAIGPNGLPTAAVGGAGGASRLVTGPNGLPTADIGNSLSNAVPGWVSNYLIPGLNTVIGANAANNATDAQTAAYQAAIDESKRQYDTTRSDLMPWLSAGTAALGRLQDPNTNFLASPDYGFRRSEGTRGIENLFSAKGGAQSGNALRALDEFNSNLASGEFGNWWNRQAGLAGVGQTTGTQLGTLGANNANNVGNYLGASGDARASGVLGRNAALLNGINTGYQNWLYQRPRP